MCQRIATPTDEFQTTGSRQSRNVEGKIEQRPLVRLAVAFAAGLMVGRILDRR